MIGFGLAHAFVEFSARGGSAVENQISRITSGIRSIVALAGGGLGIAGSLAAASQLEQLNIAFNTLTGSGEEATKMIEELRKASRTIEFTELASAAQKLVALGFEADQSAKLVKNLQDILTATGRAGDQGAINSVILALTQMRAAGAVTAEEMRQLKNQNIDALGILSSVLGKNADVIKKMVEARQIGADVLINAILRMDGPLQRMAGFADKAGNSLLGQWVQIKNALFFAGAELGTMVADLLDLRNVATGIKGAMQALISVVRRVAEVVSAVNQFFGGWPAKILATSAALVVVIGLVQQLLIAAKALLFNPFTIWIVALGALVAVLGEVTGLFDQVRRAGILAASGIGDAWDALFDLWDAQLQAFSAKLSLWLETQATKFENFFLELFGQPLTMPDLTFDDAALARLELAKRRWEELKNSVQEGGAPFDNFLEGLKGGGEIKLKFDSGAIEDLNKAIQNMQAKDIQQKMAGHLAAIQKGIGGLAAAGAGRGINVNVKNPFNQEPRFA